MPDTNALWRLLSAENLTRVSRHLENRRADAMQVRPSVLFDLTYACNLECAGCGVNACLTDGLRAPLPGELGTSRVIGILDRVSESLRRVRGLPPRLCFGGGEPLLRQDLVDILRHAAGNFGAEHVTVDTNGTLLTSEALRAIAPYVGRIEFGCEGLSVQHNAWRDPRKRCTPCDPFAALVDAVKRCLAWRDSPLTVEMLYLPTRHNLRAFPDVIAFWAGLGVHHFSIHRCMPTGRMQAHPELIPTHEDYLSLFQAALDLQQERQVRIHLHHSIEHTLSALLFGRPMPQGMNRLCPNWRATVTIDAFGFAHFCPWAVNGPLSRLRLGDVHDIDVCATMASESAHSNPDAGAIRGCPVPMLIAGAVSTPGLSGEIDGAAVSDPVLTGIMGELAGRQ